MRIILFFAIISISVFSLSISAQKEREGSAAVSVSNMNERATMLVKPTVPDDLVISGADGTTLSVNVTVDGDGHVVSAKCSASCHPQLKAVAETAAKASKFEPLVVDGRPVRYQGSVKYPVAMGRVDWYAVGLGLRSAQLFEATPVAPAAAFLTSAFDAERIRLRELDTDTAYPARIVAIDEVIGSLRNRLAGKDAWLFNLGLAMRRITASLNTTQIDRAEVQKGIAEMAAMPAAPAGVSKEVTDKVGEISQFKIAPDISDTDLRTAIFRLTLLKSEPK